MVEKQSKIDSELVPNPTTTASNQLRPQSFSPETASDRVTTRYCAVIPGEDWRGGITHLTVYPQFTRMANITVSVDDDLKQKMEQHPEINWSEVARQAFQEKLEDLELMEMIASESEFTEEDVEELSRKIDESVADQLVRE